MEDKLFTLKKEIMLQINQNLYNQQAITKEAYEMAKIKIISLHS